MKFCRNIEVYRKFDQFTSLIFSYLKNSSNLGGNINFDIQQIKLKFLKLILNIGHIKKMKKIDLMNFSYDL